MLEHCCKQKPTICFPFFRAFLSDRIPKTTKNINVHFLTPSKLYIEFRELLKLLFKKYFISSAFPPDVQCIGSALEVRPRKNEFFRPFGNHFICHHQEERRRLPRYLPKVRKDFMPVRNLTAKIYPTNCKYITHCCCYYYYFYYYLIVWGILLL